MSATQGRPDHVDAARALFFAFLAVAAVFGIAALWPGIPKDGLSLLLQASFFGVPLLYARASGLRPFEASGFAPLPLRKVVLVLFAALGSMWLLQGLWSIAFEIIRWAGFEEAVRREIESLDKGIRETKKGGILLTGLVYVVASPFCEETLFRGLVFRGLARRYGVVISLVATALVFAALHEEWAQRGVMVVLGVYFGTLVWLTGSLWAGILAHAANNFAVVALSGRYGAKVEGMTAPWWMYVLSALVFAGAIALLALDRRKPTSPE